LIVEVATYPYEDEIDRMFLSILDRISVKLLSESISFVVSYTNEEPIFGKKVVHINNALDKEFVNGIKSKITLSYTNLNQEISFIAIGNLSKWHGYDRLIKSMAEYVKDTQNSKYKIIFNIVGQGKELDYLVKLSKEYKVEDNCIFHGFLKREEIVNLISLNTIGVSALANHRRGLSGDKSLKNREYVAYGLPIIKAGLDYQLDDIYDGFINIDSNEENFNLKEVLNSYHTMLGKDKLDFFIKNNEFAEKYLCWNSEVVKIIDVASEVKNDG
jgi:glycosyltransferase involved in cell wall biosynthesis